MSPSAKRALFSPSPARKRSRTTKTVVVRARGESKYDDQTLALASSYAMVSIPLSIPQGDGNHERVGDKLRITAIEVRYDLSAAVTRDFGAVIRLLIPKDPSTSPGVYLPSAGYAPETETQLHEEYLAPGSSMTGMFRWKGPLNVAYSAGSSNALKNNVHVQIVSSASSVTLANAAQVRTWYTDN